MADEPETLDTTVVKTAKVTVKKAVDGTTRKRGRSRGAHTNKKRAINTHQIVVDERVMEAAKAVCLPSQKVRIVSATEVMVVNK